jgi:hypothetical protein
MIHTAKIHSITMRFPSMRFSAEVSEGYCCAEAALLMNVILAAEDVLRDLGVRQALRVMPKDSRL